MCQISRRRVLDRVTGLHGKNGVVRVRFRRGLPEPSNGLPLLLVESLNKA